MFSELRTSYLGAFFVQKLQNNQSWHCLRKHEIQQDEETLSSKLLPHSPSLGSWPLAVTYADSMHNDPAEASAERFLLCQVFHGRSRADLWERKSSSPSVRLWFQMNTGSRGSSVFETEVRPSTAALLPHVNLCYASLHMTCRTLKWFFVCTEFKRHRVLSSRGTSGPLGGRSSAPLTVCQSSTFASFLMWRHVRTLHFWCHSFVCFWLWSLNKLWHQLNRHNLEFITFNSIILIK